MCYCAVIPDETLGDLDFWRAIASLPGALGYCGSSVIMGTQPDLPPFELHCFTGWPGPESEHVALVDVVTNPCGEP